MTQQGIGVREELCFHGGWCGDDECKEDKEGLIPHGKCMMTVRPRKHNVMLELYEPWCSGLQDAGTQHSLVTLVPWL